MMMRVVEPELLDRLRPEDPRAVGSRADLRHLNAWMGNARSIARALGQAFPTTPPRCLVDLGAGDGSLMLRVARLLPRAWRGTHVVLLDRQNTVQPEADAGLKRLGWHPEFLAADVLDWLRAPASARCDALVANLFLHHFSGSELSELLGQASLRTRVFIAVEPRRSAWGLTLCRFLWLLGCNGVTRHDAPISVRAGFARGELSGLWPAAGGDTWSLREGPAGLASHAFIAVLRIGLAETRALPGTP